jgi:hypothetical protein
MARLKRIAPIDSPQHIIRRGNRQVCFTGDQDMALGYERFKDDIERLYSRRVRLARMGRPGVRLGR